MDSPNRQPILVVDPDRAVCTLIVAVLTRDGYDAESAVNADEALRIGRARRHAAVILEPHMHRGDALLDELQSGDGKPNVIVITTKHDDGTSFASAPGVRSVLFKPVRIDELAAVVADCCFSIQ